MIIRLLSTFAAATAISSVASAESRPPTLERIADDVWIHKSYETVEPYGLVLSQGLVVKTGAGVFLIDTAWTEEGTDELLRLIQTELGEAPKMAIPTHAHADKMGGMAALSAIETAAFELTNEDAPTRGLIPARSSIKRENIDAPLSPPLIGPNGETLMRGEVEVFYPGPGHTRDNIVVYYAPAKVLFGGCLIRPEDSTSLGNTADGDVSNWADAVRKVAARFPDAEIVVPSHGPMGGRALLDHTIALAEAANE